MYRPLLTIAEIVAEMWRVYCSHGFSVALVTGDPTGVTGGSEVELSRAWRGLCEPLASGVSDKIATTSDRSGRTS